MSKKCDIVRDMMPMCVDGTASETTQAYVEEHVDRCAPCKTIYTEMKSAVEIDAPAENREFAKAVRSMKSRRKRRTWLTLLLGVLLALLLVLLLAVGYAWYCMNMQQVPAGKIAFRQTTEKQGLAMMHLTDIPEGAEVRISVTATDRDGDGQEQYEAYVSVWATRYQQRSGALQSAYYIIGSAKDGGLYMNSNGRESVQISQIVSGTVEGGGQVVYLTDSDMPQVALFGLTVKTPDVIDWQIRMQEGRSFAIMTNQFGSPTAMPAFVTPSPRPDAAAVVSTPMPVPTEEASN